MRKLKICIAVLICALNSAEINAQETIENRKSTKSGNAPTSQADYFQVQKLNAKSPKVLKKYFSKQVTVFGVRIVATSDTPNRNILHAANVLAQYLDNDADGKPDDSAVVQSMVKHNATLIIFATERASRKVIRRLEREDLSELKNAILQDLYAEEIHPNGARRGVFDATYEEVLHLISHAGYAKTYPKIFGEKPGTKLCDAMDIARGGRFLRLPKKYPKEAWYTYEDSTCDYSCQATEYFYWGLTSLLGAQKFKGRLEQIREEWRLNTPEKFKAGDKKLFEILSDKKYKLPTQLPDGKYRPHSKSNQ